MSSPRLTEPAKLLLLVALLANDKIISNSGKSFLKEVILRRDPELVDILQNFESKTTQDSSFVEAIHEIIKREAEITFNDILVESSVEVGKTLSKKERERRHLLGEKSLIYGEVEFRSFYDVLRTINPPPGQVFYDLGSGTGKALFVARLTYDFSRCTGIEILEDLHQQARRNLDRFNSYFPPSQVAGEGQKVEVHHGSFLDFDWSDGDVVFANSTCFEDELMNQLTVAAERLKPGAIVVTFTKGMISKAFETIDKRRHKMSWGPATVFIHRRLRADGKPAGAFRLNRFPSDRDYDDDDTFDFSHAISMSMQSHDPPQAPVISNDMMDVEEFEDNDDDMADDPSPPPMLDSPVAKRDHFDDIMGSPQDSALLRRKRILHDKPSTTSAGSMSPEPKGDQGMNVMGSPQDTALMRRKRATKDHAAAIVQGTSSPLPPTRDEYGMDIMGSPQDTALMRRKRAVGKPA